MPQLAEMLADPQLRFTLVPENVMKFVEFKVRTGSVRTIARGGESCSFPRFINLPGS
ncbi:MAG: hypothetical protein ACM3JC_00475 [Rudaea sp.]